MKVLISGRFSEGEKKVFKEHLGGDVIFDDVAPAPEALADVRVALMTSWRSFSPLVPSMPRLEMVQCFFAGADRFDFGKMPPDVTVATASGALATAVSEHAFSLLLSLCRDLDLHRRRLDEGVFEQLDPLNRELFGKSIGIVGYGPIGQRIGRIAKAFGMRTLALNTSGKSDADATYTLEGLDRMLKESDYVVICIPLNRHTDGLIGKDMLSLMKENAILVNVSRGKVLVEKDLYEHLRDHPSFKAGLDVWWHYPRDGETWSQDYDFGKLPNIAMTPHNAALVPGWRERTIVFCCRNMLDHMNGKKIRNKVRREDYLI